MSSLSSIEKASICAEDVFADGDVVWTPLIEKKGSGTLFSSAVVQKTIEKFLGIFLDLHTLLSANDDYNYRQYRLIDDHLLVDKISYITLIG